MHISDIVIRGAREHNLQNISVTIPRERLSVICGLSGSGKSSLAFDTLYSEGQRRYVESLNTYARQFLGLMEKPDVDSIEGLSPAIAIEQKSIGHNPRSTVGTITEINDYLRLLFARIGTPTCYQCGRVIQRQTVQEICDKIMGLAAQTKFQIIAPIVNSRKGEYRELIEKLHKDGFVRLRIDGTIRTSEEEITLEKNKKHTIEVVVDRLVNSPSIRKRLTDSLETSLKLSANSTVIIDCIGAEELIFSEALTCPVCGISYKEISPRFFSFNSPFGACPTCSGLGYQLELDEHLVVPDPSVSLTDGAIPAWNGAATEGSWNRQIMAAVCKHYAIAMDKPFGSLSKKLRDIILYGSGSEKITFQWRPHSGEGNAHFVRQFEGVIPNLLRRYKDTNSEGMRQWIESYMSSTKCPSCKGMRLRPESLAILIDNKNIGQLSTFSIDNLRSFFSTLKLSRRQEQIGYQVLKEIVQRLTFLFDVGLPYLCLDRAASTLSGGEAQRIRLATQIGSRLTGVTYILDEPSIGLHACDNAKLLKTLLSLRDLGNTVIVIEHDKETIAAADYCIDIGPGAGVHGGQVVAVGTPQEIADNPKSLTGLYLSGRKKIPTPTRRRQSPKNQSLILTGASGNNLKSVDVTLPLELLICVTGVSGSGKSSLINQTLFPLLSNHVNGSKLHPLPYGAIKGLHHIDKIIDIDQSPIGRTPRSNPATYTKIFDQIRDLFATLPESKIAGYSKSRFSFNVKGGRCENCEGDGVLRIEMHFLPDVYVQCEACGGKRYNRETLEITYRGKTIADILDMTVDEAATFFKNITALHSKLSLLSSVGLGYIHLGQQATTLSGGEAQRIKLAAELSKKSTGKTLYILDEPTTGLHFEDILLLITIIQELVDKKNSVIIIEHNLDVIKCADYIIDLGPEGGDKGGRIVACGTPEEIIHNQDSITGRFLAPYLS
ncbi:MAG: excinuclease ABC subunit UvrA [Chitinivibrionales bacterium]|nr:excinuclease ABC subunit UvrA [Chitinivibrionales bacterium]